MLASAAAYLLADRVQDNSRRLSSGEAIDVLLEKCARVPYAALVAAAAIVSIDDARIIHALIDELLAREPVITRVKPDARLSILLEGQPPIDVPSEALGEAIADGSDHLTGNHLPYLVLSYIIPRIDLSSEGGLARFAQIVDRVGGVGVPLLHVEFASTEQLRTALPITTHALSGGRSLLDASNGIIEPLTHALRLVALDAPQVFADYVRTILDREMASFPLLYRTWLAAHSVSETATPQADNAYRLVTDLDARIKQRIPVEFSRQPD